MGFYYIRKTAALLLLAAPAGLMSYVAVASIFGDSPWSEVATMAPFLVASLLALVGLALGKAWGRWLALAGACAGLTSVGLRVCIQGFDAQALACGAYCGLLLVCLLGRRMVQRHEEHPASGAPLTCGGWRARCLSWGAILSLAALPGLWFSAFIVPLDNTGAGVSLLTVLLIIGGTVALARGRTAGILLFGAAAAVSAGATLWTVVQIFRSTLPAGILLAETDLMHLPLFALGLTTLSTALLLCATARPMWLLLRRSRCL